MGLFDGYTRDTTRVAADLFARTALFYAHSARAGMEIARAANPMLAVMLDYMEQHPNGWRVNGVRKMVAGTPFKDAAARYPDSVGFQLGTGPTSTEKRAETRRPAPTQAEIQSARIKAADAAGVMRDFLARPVEKLPRDFREATFKASVTHPERNIEAAAFLTDLQYKQHPKAAFSDLLPQQVSILGEEYKIQMEKIDELDRPHADVLRFSTAWSESQPQDSNNVVYLKAPMSGHYSTLIYNVVQNYLNAGFTVYLEDKKCASTVPVGLEDHGIDNQVDYDRDALSYIYEREGTRAHLTSICQASIPASITAAVLSQEKAEYRPAKLAVISAPTDISINPSLVNKYAKVMPEFLVAFNELELVPPWKPGFMRSVRSGAKQVSSFESGNPGRFMSYYASIYNYITGGSPNWENHKPLLQKELGEALREPGISPQEKDFLNLMTFIVEYKTYMDMDGRAFLDSWFQNFGQNFIAEGTARYHGRKVNFDAIDFPVLTVDATDDDISSVGQSMAFLRKISKGDKRALVVPDKGHFWWSGGTAKAIQWPLIFAWHKADLANSSAPVPSGTVLDAGGEIQHSPILPGTCENPEALIDLARKIHDKNLDLEEQKVASGSDLSFTMIVNGQEVTFPLYAWPLQPGHA